MSAAKDAGLDALLALGDAVVARARKAGADVAEAVISEGSHLSVRSRLREAEHLEEAGSRSVGVRVMIGQRVAVSYTSDTSESGLERLASDAVELARLSEPDPFAGPPDAALLSSARDHVDLDLFDAKIDGIDGAAALAHAIGAERAAFEADARISNSEGGSFTRASGARALVTSGGFRGATRGTYASLSVSPVADDEGGKRRTGSHWTARRHYAELERDAAVGAEAARRTLAKLGARKIDSCECPVVFDPDVARSIVGLVASSVNGGAIWRRASYLLDRVGTRVASDLVTIVDDPLVPRGPGSRAFDGEGLASRKNVVVERGELRTYLVDSYAGRKLSLPSTASASRGGAGGVSASTSNFFMLAGETKAADIVASTPRGLYVTELMGFGWNAVTGDFSRGAAGFWIEGGEKAFPVSEITISLNLDELLRRIDAVGDDLDMRTSVASPTFRVSAMTVAGR